jgi:replicative DNA helicase
MSEENRKLPFGSEFQQNMLRLMIQDEKFFHKSVGALKAEYFDNKHLSWIFDTTVNYWNDYQKIPNFTVLGEKAKHHEIKEQQAYIDSINEVANSNGFDELYVRRELTAFVRRNIFVDTFKRAASLYNRAGGEDSAYKFMQDKINELIEVDFEVDDIVDWNEIEETIEESRLSSETAVPTGIDPIDDALGGGMMAGTLTVLLAPTNAGKSMFLVNVLYAAIRAKKKVVFIVHEDEPTPTILRVISRFTGIPYNKLRVEGNLLSELEKQKIELVKALLKKYAVMKFMYGSETTVEEVRDWLFMKKREFDYDLIIDDYGQFIRTRVKTEGERFTQSIVYRTLKQIGLQTSSAVLSVAQGNRMAQKVAKRGVDYLRSTDLAECFEIARTASNLITLNRSDEMIEKNELVYFLEKNKNGKVNIAVKCNTDYSRCITHDSTSLGMYLANSLNPLLEDVDVDKEE